MRKYELERESRKKAAQAIIGSMSRDDIYSLEDVVDRVLSNIARNLCLSDAGRNLVLEYVRSAVGLSIAEAILQGVEILVGGMFDDGGIGE